MKPYILQSILLGVLLFIVISCKEGVSEHHLMVILPDGKSLNEGAAVQYRGIQVGQVNSIFLHEKRPAAKITLEKDAPDITKADGFRVDLASLMGDSVLTIIPSEQPGEPLENGSIFEANYTDSAIKDLDVFVFGKDSEALLELISELTSLPQDQRELAINECMKIIEQQKCQSKTKRRGATL